MTSETQLIKQGAFCEYSDVHKDLYGFRPRGAQHTLFMKMSLEKQRQMLDSMYKSLEKKLEQERQKEQKEMEEFDSKVEALGLNPLKYRYLFR